MARVLAQAGWQCVELLPELGSTEEKPCLKGGMSKSSLLYMCIYGVYMRLP